MLPPATQLVLDLFEATPYVMVCVKDEAGTYLAVNEMFARRVSERHPRNVVGCSAADFFPADLVSEYRARDQALLQSRVPTHNQLEMVTDVDGRRDWFLTSQIVHDGDPGFDPVIVAVSSPARFPTRSGDAGAGLSAAIEMVRGHTGRPLRVEDIASEAGLTTDQLERVMQRVLGVSPKQYLMRARLDQAAHLLATTSRSISDIAVRCGYYDQSQLTKYFRAAIGVTPLEYRVAAGSDGGS